MVKKADNSSSPIVQDGDPILRAIAAPVNFKAIDSKELNAIIARMKKALEAEEDGVAIAAPQIGISLRIFIVSHRAFNIEYDEEEGKAKPKVKAPEKTRTTDMVCINPEITKLSKRKVKVPEGCLSVRWKYGNTKRSDRATVRAYDEHGNVFTYGGSGLMAQIFQHETDHLNGILFIEHAKDIEEMPPEEVEEMRKRKRERHD
jgi:peptide deformylase